MTRKLIIAGLGAVLGLVIVFVLSREAKQRAAQITEINQSRVVVAPDGKLTVLPDERRGTMTVIFDSPKKTNQASLAPTNEY